MNKKNSKSKRRVIHLDDDILISEFYREELDDKGFEVRLMHRVSECFDELKKAEVWDALILDVMMPHADHAEFDYSQSDDGLLTGVLITRKVRELYPDLPIFILTNRTPSAIAGHLHGALPSKYIKSKFDYPPDKFANFLNKEII
jgi:CheY-like chemotaxis protein